MNRAMPLALFLVGLLLAGCRSWDEVRKDFVDPVNSLLHSKYPAAWRAMSLDEILAFYAPELAQDDGFRRDKATLLARFLNIEQSAYILDDVRHASGGRRFTSRGYFKLRGTIPEERRLAIEQWYEIAGELRGETWQIVSEKLVSEQMAYSRTPAFTEEAEKRGIQFTHASQGVVNKHKERQSYSAGSGLAVGDYNDDGHEDLYLVSGAGGKLYRNRGDGTFEDVTAAAQLDEPFAGEGRAATFADYDGDGHTDLFVALLEAPNRLYRNRGDGTFEDVAARVGLRQVDQTVGAAFADFDRDGRLDLFLANGEDLFNVQPEPIYNARNARPNTLYMGRADGTFEDRTVRAGVGDTGWALAVATADYDLDGDTDIFVGNDVGQSVLYRNRGDATFDDVTVEAGVAFRGSTMSAAWGDLNGDGYPDLLAAAMDSNSRWMIDQPGFPSPAPWYVNILIRPLILDVLKEMLYGNRFYLNNGDGTFQEVADAVGLRRNGWAWSTVFLDYDHDGFLDVYGVNGFISGEQKQDL